MALIGNKTKQPGETRVYTADFTRWFSNRTDSPSAFTVTTTDGITVAGQERDGMKIKVALSGGDDGARYKVTVKMFTNSTPTTIKEADFYVAVREV